MYFIDDNQAVSNSIPDSPSARNMGLKRRHGICTAKPTFDMIGSLHVDVFNQSKHMLNGVTMKVRMTRSKDSFVLMAKSDVTEFFKIYIISANLFVRKLKITPSLCLAHERFLQQKTAKYPITHVECKVIHLPQGKKSFTHNNLFLCQLSVIREQIVKPSWVCNELLYSSIWGLGKFSADIIEAKFSHCRTPCIE